MNLSSSSVGATQIITVEEARIDAAVAIQFKDRMREVSDGGPARIVLNLRNVDFIDSSGLGAIVAAMKQLEDGRTLDLCALTPNVDKVFRLTRMDTIFGIFDSVDDAVAQSNS
ncbi:STAS domain-containing protein [Primorskyibacter marinus]|uniref:STAS domain-containing protein n=1 Tax=Primorskyibacter marinus TaxID=1977320 RepID=UPI000E30B20A|nr:STAS domain-containing protein [Primorskyibacter marinus]